MKKIILLFLCTGILSAEQWPQNSQNIKNSLGESLRGYFNYGLVFQSEETDIRPFEDGEIIFITGENGNDVPNNMGDVIVVEHNNGFHSLYGNVEVAPSLYNRDFITSRDYLGSSENLYFWIYDVRMMQFVNPVRVLPRFEDNSSPEISEILLSGSTGKFTLKNGSVIPAGTYKVYLKCQDLRRINRSTVKSLAPYRITVESLGQVVGIIQFDALKKEDRFFLLQGESSYSLDELYSKDGYYNVGALTIKSGKGSIDVDVRDYNGNTDHINIVFSVE